MPSSPTVLLERHLEGGGALRAGELPSLRCALEGVPDPRARRGVRYPFTDLLLVLVGAVFSGAKSLTMIADWAHHAAGTGPLFPAGRLPSVATLHRVITGIDPEVLDTAVNAWIRARTGAVGTPAVIAVDGKEVRGAKNGQGARVFLMAALDHGTGTVIGQESIGDKTNEIPHFGPLMDRLGDLAGAVVTADALHTQSGHAQDLHARGAHYVFTVKTNQRRLRERIASQSWSTRSPVHVCRQKAHGRTTTWSATAQPAQEWIGFPHAAQTVRLTRDRHDHATGAKTREQVFVITSLTAAQATAGQIAQYIRGHWGHREPPALGQRHRLRRGHLTDQDRQRRPCHGHRAEPGHQHPPPCRRHQHHRRPPNSISRPQHRPPTHRTLKRPCVI